MRLVASVRSVLVPLSINGSALALPAADTAVTAIVVVQAGTWNFIVGAPSTMQGVFTITTARDPNPRLLCVRTQAMRGVSFASALTSSCRSREVDLIPVLAPQQRLRVAVSSGRALNVELRNAVTGQVLTAQVDNDDNGSVLTFTNGSQAQYVSVRIRGPGNVNETVRVVIDP